MLSPDFCGDSGFRALDTAEPVPTINVIPSHLQAAGPVMANDYIARPDGDFHANQNNLVTYVSAHCPPKPL